MGWSGMEAPRTRLDTRDPGKAGVRDIRDEVDCELDAHPERDGLVLLVPETRWDEFVRLSGAPADDEAAIYRGATLKRAAVTAVVVQQGF
ncbi:MAG: hypothetical protein JSR98_01700 [Proteobacteria bacterium]|nr:hypothetical protein [Pseudomonadota bacterium]